MLGIGIICFYHQSKLKNNENVSLCPRKSFELWEETVRFMSLPWQYIEIKAALVMIYDTLTCVMADGT